MYGKKGHNTAFYRGLEIGFVYSGKLGNGLKKNGNIAELSQK